MTGADLLADAFGRVREQVHEVVEGLAPDTLTARIDPEANSIAWLVWHLTRVQDDHVCAAAGTEQEWTRGDWVTRFDLPYARLATGYGHSSRQVGRMHVTSGALLVDYHDAVQERTADFVRALDGPAMERVVDERWSPPVTLGVRLVSVVAEGLQHVGQAAFVQGVLERRDG
ncbi:mycothiol transferase [Streptomyces sp. LE64]|uniref:mycothiol transferase n=1 Tax=Streptomyces sp. LE64 TaxID=3448653 RepID=UPI004040F6A6